MGTNCAPLSADLFMFCYERDSMMSLSDDKQADIIDAFNTTSRYLDDILNINNIYFDNMVSPIYTLQNFNVIKQILRLLKSRFWTCLCSFPMIFFLSKFMINVTI